MRRPEVFVFPFHEAGREVSWVERAREEAFGGAEEEGGIVAPCAGWLVVGTEAAHVRDWVGRERWARAEFDGHAEGVAGERAPEAAEEALVFWDH